MRLQNEKGSGVRQSMSSESVDTHVEARLPWRKPEVRRLAAGAAEAAGHAGNDGTTNLS